MDQAARVQHHVTGSGMKKPTSPGAAGSATSTMRRYTRFRLGPGYRLLLRLAFNAKASLGLTQLQARAIELIPRNLDVTPRSPFCNVSGTFNLLTIAV